MATNTVTEKRTTQRTVNGGIPTERANVEVYDHVAPAPSRPMDRVRWGAIFAGLVTALSTLVVLSILGLAIGLTTFEPGDRLGNFGIGAGIWGAISTILAFLLGGWVAASSAAARGRGNALLNGAMVWAVAIPLMMYMLGTGAGALLNMATDVAAGAVPAVIEGTDTTGANAAATAPQTQTQPQVDPATIDRVTQDAGEAAWGTLIALLLGLAAAAGGGLIGERKREDRYQDALVA